MAIPISYNLRNLRLRWGATLMTALGVALTVAVASFILALLSGLHRAFQASGNPLNVLVMRKGLSDEVSSSISRGKFGAIKFLPGIAVNAQGQPLASGSLVVVVSLRRRGGDGRANVTLRGLGLQGLALRPGARLVAGHWPQAGRRQIAVGVAAARQFQKTQLGDRLHFGKGDWRVVGEFQDHGSAFESEIWAPRDEMAADFGRPDFSSVLLRAVSPAAASALVRDIESDRRLKLHALTETAYYAQQTSSGAPIAFIGGVIAFIMAIGACFAAMNTMYAAVAYRAREIATLRILGFPRPSILLSFVLESVVLTLFGGVLGIAALLPWNGLTTGTLNSTTFSEMVFQLRFTPHVLADALIFALVLGLIGGLAPAWHASRENILTALRG